MTTATVLVSRRDGIVTITLNRPDKKNALDRRMWDELGFAIAQVKNNPEDKVLVLTGADNSFCSGADLTSLPGLLNGKDFLTTARQISDAILALHRLPQPTIARLNGDAVGAGANLALGCDLVIAAEEARLIQIYSNHGLTVDCGASWILPRIVGLQKAKELAFLAEPLSAVEAQRLGLVGKVVKQGELDRSVAEWAEQLCQTSAAALSMTKRLLNEGAGRSMDEVLEDESRCLHIAFGTEFCQNRIEQYLANRSVKEETLRSGEQWAP